MPGWETSCYWEELRLTTATAPSHAWDQLRELSEMCRMALLHTVSLDVQNPCSCSKLPPANRAPRRTLTGPGGRSLCIALSTGDKRLQCHNAPAPLCATVTPAPKTMHCLYSRGQEIQRSRRVLHGRPGKDGACALSPKACPISHLTSFH